MSLTGRELFLRSGSPPILTPSRNAPASSPRKIRWQLIISVSSAIAGSFTGSAGGPGGEGHLDVEAALGPGPRGERGAVCPGDRLHDGQAQPMPAGVPDALAVGAAERLEQAAEQ